MKNEFTATSVELRLMTTATQMKSTMNSLEKVAWILVSLGLGATLAKFLFLLKHLAELLW